MSRLSKDEQSEIAERLENFWASVFLRCDGYLVKARLQRVSTNRLVIVVFVDGWIKGEWMSFDPEKVSEEAKRFFRPSSRALYNAKEIKKYEKALGKRKCKKFGVYQKVVIPVPGWSRPMPFIRHVLKMNKSVELIDRETYENELKIKQGLCDD